MFWKWLKQYLPRGLYGRAAMILLVPIITIQLVVSVMFIQRHFTQITQRMTGAVVLELGYITQQINAAPSLTQAQGVAAGFQGPLALHVTLPGVVPGDDTHFWTDFTARRVFKTLRDGLPGITGVNLANMDGSARVGITTKFGPMLVVFERGRVSATNPHQLLVLMVFTSLLMTVIAYLFLRNQLRPIRRLAHAAEAFGKGQVLPYRLAGATEVRSAGRAFLDMRARIERQIEQRTMMLSGISHDLRTPLTRLKLGLAMLEESEDRAALARDVSDMERLVDEFLSFARSETLEDQPEPVNLAEMARSLAENAARAGHMVELGQLDQMGEIWLRPAPVARALENLLMNATRYGTRARLSIISGKRDIRFVIEDDGPGIKPEARSEALKPFARLDASRNQNKGSGVGLGLAIADDIARGHGGRLRLGESADLGGLKVELTIAR